MGEENFSVLPHSSSLGDPTLGRCSLSVERAATSWDFVSARVQISSGAGDPEAAVVARVSAMFSTSSAKAVTAAAGIMLSTAACSTGSHDAAVVKVTQAFTSAVQHRDGTAACALLTDDARQAVSGATDIPCAKAVTSAAYPGTSVRTVEVWSDTAQVRIGADVIFLRRTGNTWKVSAAGCKPQPAGPYQCTVGG